VLVARGNVKDTEEAKELREQALKVVHHLLPLNHPPELDDATDEAISFDHLLPISPGGPRFMGQRLLQYFMHS